MAVVERAVTVAGLHMGTFGDGAQDVRACALHCFFERQALRQVRGNGRGQGAARTVHIAAGDALRRQPQAGGAGLHQQVHHLIAREVPALDQCGACTQRQQAAARILERLRTQDGAGLAQRQPSFDDARLEELLFRYRARNWPDSLRPDEAQRWQQHRTRRLLTDASLSELTLAQYREEIAALRNLLADAPATLAGDASSGSTTAVQTASVTPAMVPHKLNPFEEELLKNQPLI